MSKGRMTVAVVIAALFLLSGCSQSSDKPAEKASAGSSSASSASSAPSSSSASSSSENGSTSTPASGSSSDGPPTIGEGLPAGFPSELAPPKGTKVVNGIKDSSSGQKTLGVSYGVNDDVKTAYERVKAQVKSAGYNVSVDQVTNAGDSSIGTLQGTKGSSTVSVLVGADVQGSGQKTMVTMTIQG